jgi:hypothetical protein
MIHPDTPDKAHEVAGPWPSVTVMACAGDSGNAAGLAIDKPGGRPRQVVEAVAGQPEAEQQGQQDDDLVAVGRPLPRRPGRPASQE